MAAVRASREPLGSVSASMSVQLGHGHEGDDDGHAYHSYLDHDDSHASDHGTPLRKPPTAEEASKSALVRTWRRVRARVMASRPMMTLAIVCGWILTTLALSLVAWLADGTVNPLGVYFYNCFTVRPHAALTPVPTARAPHSRAPVPAPLFYQTFSNLNDELGLALVAAPDGTYTVRAWGVALNMLTIVLGMIAIALLTAALTASSQTAHTVIDDLHMSVQALAALQTDAILDALAHELDVVRATALGDAQKGPAAADRIVRHLHQWLDAQPWSFRLPRFKLEFLVCNVLEPLVASVPTAGLLGQAGRLQMLAIAVRLQQLHPELGVGSQGGAARVSDAWRRIFAALG